MIYYLPRNIANQILQQAQTEPAHEVCGLIGGSTTHATTCYPIANIAATPDRRFEMNPRQQIDALRQMRERGEVLFAIYHSHPTSAATPSATDIAEASYPEALNLIISLATAGILEIKAYHIRQQRVLTAELCIE